MVESLCPSVKLRRGRLYSPHHDGERAEYEALRPDIVRAQKATCQYCGFSSVTARGRNVAAHSLEASGYLEIHHLDNNHENNKKSNLVLACPFCHQINHIGMALRQNRGVFVWLPYISQENLNHLLICLFVAMHRGEEIGESAKGLFHKLMQQQEKAEQYYPSVNNRQIVVPVLARIEKSGMDIAQRLQLWSGLRFLALPEQYQRHIKYWAANAVFPGKSWESEWRDLAAFVSGSFE